MVIYLNRSLFVFSVFFSFLFCPRFSLRRVHEKANFAALSLIPSTLGEFWSTVVHEEIYFLGSSSGAEKVVFIQSKLNEPETTHQKCSTPACRSGIVNAFRHPGSRPYLVYLSQDSTRHISGSRRRARLSKAYVGSRAASKGNFGRGAQEKSCFFCFQISADAFVTYV
ncbi:hypothetical protein BSKO_07053 [Bryopsis sp. KO-2023]|nr:hypothetical protein BSKO_07053 [Bryopsis sp. KO-2023]